MMKSEIVIAVIVLTTAFFAGRFSRPSKIEVRTEYIVKKETIKEKKENRNNIVTHTKIVKPDGTVEIENKIDRSVNLESDVITSHEALKFEDKQIEYFRPNWNVRFLYNIYPTLPTSFDYKQISFGIDYRVFSNVFVSSEISMGPSLKLGAGYSF